MATRDAGRAPVTSVVAAQPQPQEGAVDVATQNYLTIRETLAGNKGAEARAMMAIFGGNKSLRDEFLAVAFNSFANNRDLMLRATPMSVVSALRDAASLGLKPDGIEGAIVEYDGIAKFMPMYQGYKKRMLRSGKIIAVDAKAVYTEDEFDYWTGPMGTEFRHHPHKATRDSETGARLSSRGTWQGFYAYARTPDGFVYFRYMDVDQVNQIRDNHGQTHTKSGKPLPWTTDYEAMCLKTVIKSLANDVPQEAIGREFLIIDRDHDEAADALRDAQAALSEGLSEVRQLALAAVSGSGERTDAPDEGSAERLEELRSAGETQAATPTDSDMQRETVAQELRGMGVPEDEIQRGLDEDPEPPLVSPLDAAIRLAEEQDRRQRR